MAGIWCLLLYRQQNGDSICYHQEILYIYIISYDGLTDNHLPVCGVLDEYQKLYTFSQTQSTALLVK